MKKKGIPVKKIVPFFVLLIIIILISHLTQKKDFEYISTTHEIRSKQSA